MNNLRIRKPVIPFFSPLNIALTNLPFQRPFGAKY